MTHGAQTPASLLPSRPVAQARWFRVLADPTRLEILIRLLERPHSVAELIESTGLPQSRISNHLACLRWCEFVRCDRSGRNMIYTIADSRVKVVIDLAAELVAENAEHLATCRRIGPDWM